MEQLPSYTLRVKLIEYKKDEIYFLVIIAKNATDASHIDLSFNKTNTIEWYRPAKSSYIIIRINLIDYKQYYYIEVINDENAKEIGTLIDNNKITHLLVYYSSSNNELASYGNEHPLTL